MSIMFVILKYQKVCIDEFNCLHWQEAYRKAVQESRGALEEEEDDASKADNKEQVIQIILDQDDQDGFHEDQNFNYNAHVFSHASSSTLYPCHSLHWVAG